ncbi:MAG: fumarylacetoacetate hydrolase family protein [Candidatus Eremiobacteraeota bacterium]|nr:fumarylacetoacetate hydrolase family protein [Candidatus Eremiobacteraeota bacterium]
MRFVTFRSDEGRALPAVIENGAIVPIDVATLLDYIALEPSERVERHAGAVAVPIENTVLLAPLEPPRNVFCVGRNYLEHAAEGARAQGRELKLPKVPTFFTKAPTAVVGPEAAVHLQASISSEYDFEAELAVVIGTRCKNVREADALSVIFGYCCFNDVTARDMQRAHVQWFKGKSLDESAPLGPWIVSSDELGDPHDLEIVFRLNGVQKQHSTTGNMIFRIPRLIAELSRGMTLLPGDIIATGTPEGVGFARTPPEFLHDGDVMEVQISRIGTLRNGIELR